MNSLNRREFLTFLASAPLLCQIPKKWCVLLIDLVFNPADTDPFDRSAGLKEIENMKAVLLRANQLRAPVININYKNLFYGRQLSPCTNYTIPEISALCDANWRFLEKPADDAFQGTNLASTLRRLGVTDIIFIGWDQHACVRETVEGAIRNGYRKEQLHTCFDIMQGTFTTPRNYSQMKALSITGKPKIGEELDLGELKKYYRSHTNLARKYTEIPIFKQG